MWFDLEGGETSDRDGTIEGPFDVLRGDRPAIVKPGILAEPEGHRHAIGGDFPLLGQLGRQNILILGHGAIGERLLPNVSKRS
jgi:hypothetical protein